MKILLSGALTAINSEFFGLLQMVKFHFPTPLCLNSSNWDFDYGGDTYRGAYGMGKVSPIEDSPGEIKGLQFELSGDSAEMIALALDDSRIWQDTLIEVRTGILNADYQLLDAPIVWSGLGDTMNLQEEDGSSIIQATAESSAVDFLRGHLLSYSDTDQRMLFPGDLGMNYMVAQADRPVVWPTKEFFYR